MEIEKTLRELLASPIEAIPINLRKGHKGLSMPSVPIPNTNATGFLKERWKDAKAKVLIFKIDQRVIMLTEIEKSDK